MVLGSGISVSSDAVEMADDLGVEIVFASYYGKPKARLIPASLGGTVRTRREQYHAYDDRRGPELAKAFIRGKLRNQASLLKSFAKNHPTSHIERDFFIISDEVRQWFIEERDNKQDLIFYERDPGRCQSPGSCRYKEHCR